jgi:transposase
MEKWVFDILEHERKKRKIPLEVKELNKNYYLYKATTIWNKQEKKIKKVSEYIGRITPKGVMDKSKIKEIRSIYEYGNSYFLYSLCNDFLDCLKNSFYNQWQEILACSIVKTIEPLPLKLIKSRWEKLHLSRLINPAISPNSLSELLRSIGKDYASQKEFFDKLSDNSKTFIFDLSSIFSQSENLKLAEKGYNHEHLYISQINFLLFFSREKHLPLMLRPLNGSIKDIKALRSVLDEVNLKKCIIILDRGFASYELPNELKELKSNFILPLRRNFSIINYKTKLEKSFIYRDRGIKWNVKKFGKYYLYLYEDIRMKAEEEINFLKFMKENKKTKKDYDDEHKKFGRISLLSDLKINGEKVYLMWKDRENIEVAFDSLKNELENDKTYLGDEDAVRGYFFISFISLYLYYKILNLIKEKNLSNKISVNEVLLELSKIYEVYYENKTKLGPIPERVNRLTENLGINIKHIP